MPAERIGLVLAGGGARGAYEIGALSVLLPELEARGQRPTVLVGTSVGAINVAFLAANAHLPAADAVATGLELWRSLRWEQVLAPLLAPSTALRALSYVGDVVGVAGARLTGLLDTRPLAQTLQRVIDFQRLHRNVQTGILDVAAVVGTSAATSRSVVFVDGTPVPAADAGEEIDYVGALLQEEHVRASSAIPVLFPAVNVAQPAAARGWYVDGGARLNAPLRPALSLGVDRVVVVNLTATSPQPARLASDNEPDAFRAAAVLLQGALTNPLLQDVRSLARINRLLAGRDDTVEATDGWRYRQVPFIFIAPRAREEVASLAERVFRDNYGGSRALRSVNLELIARLIGGAAEHGALLSYLFFAPEFAAALIELGRADAQRWLATQPTADGLWQLV